MIAIPGYEGLYSATEDGNIYSHRKGGNLKPSPNVWGYLMVELVNKNGVHEVSTVHRFIASAKFKVIPSDMQVDHIDEDKLNNSFDNLQLLSPRSNTVKSQGHKIRGTCVVSGNVIEFDSLGYARDEGFHKSNISECCRGMRSTHKGHTWEYV